jgi:hypothetical protein
MTENVRKMVRGATIRGTGRSANLTVTNTRVLQQTRLEFVDCWVDPPRFRRAIGVYEKEIEGTHKAIKLLIKSIDEMIAKGNDFFQAQQEVNKRIKAGFHIGNIGVCTTEEEDLKNSLEMFGNKLEILNKEVKGALDEINNSVKTSLQKFDSDECKDKFKENKKAFSKASEKYYSSMTSGLSLGEKELIKKKGELKITQADDEAKHNREAFHACSLRYVHTLLQVEEKKKYVLPELVLLYAQKWSLALRNSMEHMSKYEDRELQIQKQLNDARVKHENSQMDIFNLMQKHKTDPVGQHDQDDLYEGHVLVMEKSYPAIGKGIGNRIGTKWVHRHLHADLNKRKLSINHPEESHKSTHYFMAPEKSKAAENQNPIDRRFTFDVGVNEGKETKLLTFQAQDKHEYAQWTEKLGASATGNHRNFNRKQPPGMATFNLGINDHIIELVQTAITYVESNSGLETEGIYRLVGVQSKVDDLIRTMINSTGSHNQSGTGNTKIEWEQYEIRTMTSAIKGLFRNFASPLMTFELHEKFLDCVKNQSMTMEARIDNLKQLVDQLPDKNQVLLKILTQHLVKIAAQEASNKMSATNLSVCFGPVFMWKAEASCEAIFDVRFQCSVVEYLIEYHDEIFGESSEETKKANIQLRENSLSLNKRTISRSSMIDPTSRVPSITRTSGSGSTGSQSRDSKCRSQYDNFTSTPTGTVFEVTSELSSSTEALETVEEIPTSTSCSSSLGGPDESSTAISHRPTDDSLPPMTSILENQILNNSSSSNEHFISSKIETGSDQSDNESLKSEASHDQRDQISTSIFGTTSQISSKTTELKSNPNSNSNSQRRPTSYEPRPSVRVKPQTRARAIYQCKADQTDELSFEKGQIFYDVKPSENDGWFFATMEEQPGASRRGLVPGPFIEFTNDL